MFGRLPETIDPILLAEQGVYLAGELPLREMSRLAVLGEVGADMASVTLGFTCDAHGLRFLRGRIEAPMHVVCQRCLQRMAVAVCAEPVIVLFRPQESQAGVPEAAEPIVVESAWSLLTLVEDELLLALPMMPRHPAGGCPANTLPSWTDARPVEVKTDRPNPFAVLEVLRKRP